MTEAHRTSNEISQRARSDGHRGNGGGVRLPDEQYNQWWIDRVKRRIVIAPNGCWLWQGTRHPKGYGQTGYRSKTTNLHRAMYMASRGVRLTTEQYVCHSCDVRHCCNPDHLWLGSQRENLHDMVAKGRHNYKDKTHCKRGHPLSGDNVRIDRQQNGIGIRRTCVTCERMRSQSEKYKATVREYQRRRRAEKRAARLSGSAL